MIESKNVMRSERTRGALLAAAREAFASDGYAGASTPVIVASARVTRGALYHHFADKLDLFRAVVEREQAVVEAEIEAATEGLDDPMAAIMTGGEAFLGAMRDPGRRRILLTDGPAVLGVEEMRTIDAQHAGRTLVEGVRKAILGGAMDPLPPEALADLLNAVFDRVALVEDDGGDHRKALWGLIDGLRLKGDDNSIGVDRSIPT